jgi:hypothetical protein
MRVSMPFFSKVVEHLTILCIFWRMFFHYKGLWPPELPYLNPSNFHLLDMLKDNMYSNKHCTQDNPNKKFMM